MRTYKSKNQLLFIFLAVGFLIGIIYENVLYMKNITSIELFEINTLQQYLQTDVITEKYLLYVLRERIVLFGVICIGGCVKWKKSFVAIMLLVCGFLTGILGVASVLQFGIKGILVCLSAIFPQGVFYVMAYGMLFIYWFRYPQKQWNQVKTMFVILMLLLGILVEVYVNPLLMRLIVRMI